MPRNASGTYTLPTGNPVVTGTIIESAWANGTMSDIASALTNSLARDGAGGMTAALRVVDGSVSVPGLAFANETGSGLYRSAAGDVGLAILGNQILRMRSTGLDVTGALGVSGTTTLAAASASNLSYTGTLTGGTGVINIGSGQVYKDASGNVGIGTSSPSSAGNNPCAVVYGGSNQARFCLKNSATGDASGDGFQIGVDASAEAFIDNRENTSLRFTTNATERMRIDSSGNLLVGTTSPAYTNRIEAQGGFASLGHPQFNITSTSSSTAFEWVLRNGTEMQFYVNNATVAARLTTSGVWTNASDARYKENIRPVTYGLAEVMQLQPRAYNIIGSEKQEIGFVAQEVEPVLPELVESSRNSITEEDRLTLSYGQMSAVLVKAIQEQQAIINSLQDRITALESTSI